jgi:Ca-activated chloride channel homolog
MRANKLFLLCLVLLALIVFKAEIKAQDEPDDAPIKVDTLLYTIPFTVTDANGRHVSGLKKENFSIFQDGDQQEIDFFLDDQSATNIAILIDTSVSTKPVLKDIQKAARDFVKVLRPEDKALIATFDYRTSFISELTSDHKTLTKAIDKVSIASESGSAMNEAVSRIVNTYFANVKGRKAIIVLTDGIINGKSITDAQILSGLLKTDTILYPVIFKTATYYIKDTSQPNARIITPFENLKVMADLSSGRLYQKEAKNLKEAFSDISTELKKQYIVGYYPVDTGKPRKIRIRVTDRPEVKIQTKKSLNL